MSQDRNRFETRHQNLGISREELNRKYQMFLLEEEHRERLRMIMEAEQANRAASLLLSGGGGSSESVPPPSPQPGAVYWSLIFEETPGGVGYVAQSIDQDPDGNIYIGSISLLNNQNSIVRKLSSSGSVIWEKTLDNTGSADTEVSRVMAVPDNGGVVILYKGAIRKLDADGNLQWQFLQESSSPMEFTACCLNGPADNESFYVFGSSDLGNGPFQIAEFSTYTGTKSFNQSIEINGKTGYTTYANMFMNSSNNIVVGMSYNVFTTQQDWYTTIVEIEGSTLSSGVNILNQWDLDPNEYSSTSSPAPNNQNITALAVDINDNIIAHGNEKGITLIPADFSVAVGLMLDIVLDSSAWESRSLAIPNGSSGDVFVIGQYGPSVIKIVKLSSFVPEFSYTIESFSENGLILEGQNSLANSCIKIVDGAMLITAAYDDGTPKEMILKLPLTNMSGYPDTSSVTYGDFVFTNSPIVQNTIFPNTTAQTFTDATSSWLNNDITQADFFTNPSITQNSSQTSFD